MGAVSELASRPVFAGEAKRVCAQRGADAPALSEHSGDDRLDSREQTLLFGAQQHRQRPHHRQPALGGNAPAQAVVQDDGPGLNCLAQGDRG